MSNRGADDNRLHPDERALHAAVRRFYNFRTRENTALLKKATKEWLRAEHAREDARKTAERAA